MANDTQSATYTNDPANNAIDLFRFRVGDTECRDAKLTDAEIRHLLAATPNSTLRAAAAGARAISAKMASRINFSMGGVTKSAAQLFDHYRDLAKDLDREATLAGVKPEVLGITVAEKEAADQETDAVQPDFAKGMMDNPRAGPTIRSEPEPSELV